MNWLDNNIDWLKKNKYDKYTPIYVCTLIPPNVMWRGIELSKVPQEMGPKWRAVYFQYITQYLLLIWPPHPLNNTNTPAYTYISSFSYYYRQHVLFSFHRLFSAQFGSAELNLHSLPIRSVIHSFIHLASSTPVSTTETNGETRHWPPTTDRPTAQPSTNESNLPNNTSS